MRINVYAEELTTETRVVCKTVDNKEFYGIRLYLLSPDELHHTLEDDDRSAITFWVPWFHGSNHHDWTIGLFSNMLKSSYHARDMDKVSGLTK